MTLPRDSAPCPLTREVMAVTSSGSEVPRATTVRAMTDSGTPRPAAITTPLSTIRLAPTAMRAADSASRTSSTARLPDGAASGGASPAAGAAGARRAESTCAAI